MKEEGLAEPEKRRASDIGLVVGLNMELKTRVFELYNERYTNFSELAKAMGISVATVSRVRQGIRPVNQKFIIGAVKAFPGYKLDDLFYVVRVAGMTSRRDEVVKLRKAGVSDAEIGRRLGVSRERVGQIVKGNPATPSKLALDSKVMLGTSDVAQILNLHIGTVRRWSDKGILKAYRLGPRGDRRFRWEDVDALLKEGN